MFLRKERRRMGIPVRHRTLPDIAFALFDLVAELKLGFDRWRARREQGRT